MYTPRHDPARPPMTALRRAALLCLCACACRDAKAPPAPDTATSPTGPDTADTADTTGTDTGTDATTDTTTDTTGTDTAWPDLWSDDPCAGISADASGYSTTIARWQAQEALSPPPAGQIVAVGSSSMRRWEGAARDLSPWGVVQRGFGGARLWEVAAWADALINAHRPAAVLLFAGTNDIADGASADQVVTALRCVADRVWAAAQVPIWYVGITPTPARWAQWPTAAEANRQIADLADQHPGLTYIDLPAAFLATQPAPDQPPDAALFVEDGLHLSAAGYAIWSREVLAALSGLPTRSYAANPLHPGPGALIRVDLGPTDGIDGEATGTDATGHAWNSWADTAGGMQILPGEAIALRTTGGADSGMRLLISGGFLANGYRNGGLRDPDPALLQTMAVPTATGDFFYVDGPDNPGGLALTGLDPARRYTLRLFASREWGGEVRQSRYTVHGAASASLDLTTSGPGTGSDGGDANDHRFAVFTGLQPDAWGQLHLDMEIAQGEFAYLSLMELEVDP